MTFQEIGYDFSRIRTAAISKKNLLPLFLFLIISPTFFILFGVFLALFVTKTPIEINGVLRYYPGESYQAFFRTFLIITGSISVVSLYVIIFHLAIRPKPFGYLMQSLDSEQILYIQSKHMNKVICQDKIITYYLLSGDVHIDTDKQVINSSLSKNLFWMYLDDYTVKKVKRTASRINLLCLSTKKQSKRTQFRFQFDSSFQLTSYTEMVYFQYGGNTSIKSFNKFYFSAINQRSPLQIDPKISAILNQ